MKLKVIIIDDEPLARKGLREYIADTDFLELVAEFDNAAQASDLVSSGEVQLLFIDIEMPRITGLEFIRSLKQAPPVIFTTAYPQYALESYEVNALDYLVKPISFDRFLKAVLKAREFYEVRESNQAGGTEKGYFFVKADQKLVKVNYEDILFVEAMQNYIIIHTAGKKLITYLTFRAIEDYLPSDSFLKVHKSYIVAMDKIDSIEGTDIRISTHYIPISRNLRDEVMERLLGGKFLKR
jgi:DNA-binding LytR/AlgR family response regulator